MKIIYMGTPDFAVPALEALAEAGHEIGYVITQPDSSRDRGKKVKMPPVKEKALELGLDVLQPENIKKDETCLTRIRQYAPDIIAVAAYGQILPKAILDIPRLGCVNIHGSLLPRFRGAAPIQRAILEGDEETGVTIMFMEEGLDTGAMLAKASTPIDRKNGAMLHDELAELGAKLLTETLPKLEAGILEPEPQDDARSTYAPMISKKDGEIDFTKSPQQIERLIRAFDPWPGAFTSYNGKLLKIWEAEVSPKANKEPAGTITKVSADGIEISAGGGTLVAKVIQLPGKKKVAVSDHLKGNRIEAGSVLG
ncbi:MAG: methionyl-tRNA formyltransferase [Firmicutes bacterium]|jgi:methionyl-tRNA formyltransferase|nr:methionyl-tRNA formyltransferase [Bacillota bacterium]